MRLRLASSLGISLLVALAAVLIDRTALRGLGLDGTAVVVLERPASSEVAPPPVLPVPAVEPAFEPVAARPSTTYPVTAAEAAAQSCDGRCDIELAGWRRNQGNLAFRTALELCVRRCRSFPPAPVDPLRSHDGCSDDEGEEDDMAALFGQAVERLRERDTERGCAKLEQVALRAPTGSIWRDKAQTLRSRRCDLAP